MSRLLITASLAALFATSAYAADIPSDIPAYEPVATEAGYYDWSGFYIGTQFGWGWGDQELEDEVSLDDSVDLDGGFFGPVLGVQKQWNWFVLGAEVEANWSDIDGKDELETLPGRAWGDLEIFGSAGVKVGAAWDRLLVFALGGVSGAETATSQRDGPANIEDHAASFGWMAGAGLDYAVTDNLFLGVVYRHYDLGEADYEMGFAVPDRTGETTLDTVSGRIGLKFGGF